MRSAKLRQTRIWLASADHEEHPARKDPAKLLKLMEMLGDNHVGRQCVQTRRARPQAVPCAPDAGRGRALIDLRTKPNNGHKDPAPVRYRQRERGRSPSVREETYLERICVVCKQLIEPRKHVAIDLMKGKYCHATCYNEFERQQKSEKHN